MPVNISTMYVRCCFGTYKVGGYDAGSKQHSENWASYQDSAKKLKRWSPNGTSGAAMGGKRDLAVTATRTRGVAFSAFHHRDVGVPVCVRTHGSE